MEDVLQQLKSFLWQFGIVAVVAGVLLIVLRKVLQRRRKANRARRQQQGDAATAVSENGDESIPVVAPRGTQRTWMVSGVEKDSGEDATWFIEAESRANAKVKAELKGMIVTAVVRAPEQS